MRTNVRWIVAGAALAGLLLTAAPAAAGTPHRNPSLSATQRWGWVTVRHPSSGTYTPAAADRGNSAGRVNVVKRTTVGHYTIIFKGLSSSGGVPHVSAMSSSQRICRIEGWVQGSGTNEEVSVSCYTPGGTATDSRFTVSYFFTQTDPGPMAYLWATGVTQDAISSYSFNSESGVNHIDRIGTGYYNVTLPGLGNTYGTVQVTARNGGFASTSSITPAGVNPISCNAGSWGTLSGNLTIGIYCRNAQGALTDSEFTLSYSSHEGLKGHGKGKTAGLWADRAASASYQPDLLYQYSSAGQHAHNTRQGTGRYTVTLAGMPKGGAALINAYGYGNRRCQIGAIRTGGTPQQVQVRCFDFSGHAADSRFTLAYER